MRTIHIDMPGGVAGDMLLAALIDAGAHVEVIQQGLEGLGCGPLPLQQSQVMRSGLQSLKVDVDVPQEATWVQGHHHHHDHDHDHDHGTHRPFADIRDMLKAADLAERVRDRALRVFTVLAEAEAKVHGVTPDEVVFHEVGSLDSIADIVGSCLALEDLDVDRVTSGPLLLGNGTVKCAHGRMPVPVPAVVNMLGQVDAPTTRAEGDTGELTTPTGCALILGLADGFTAPGGRILCTGYGAGSKIIPHLAGVTRVTLIEEEAPTTERDTVVELTCQMDDATGEQLGILAETLLEEGALDAFFTPVFMKKNRPGYALTVLCRVDEKTPITEVMLVHGTSIGVRYQTLERSVLPRQERQIEIDGFTLRLKVVTLPDGTTRSKPEADDVRAIAEATGRTFAQVVALVQV